jgi:predicted acylesterase/phospholipase RssA
MATNAFVLSGGGAAGDFEVGAVRLLLKRNIQPDILVGTSVGAVNATKLAEGEGTPDQGFAGLLAIWLSLRWNDDMWKPAAWVANVDVKFQRALTSFVMPDLAGPSRGNNDLEKLVNEFFWLVDDGAKILALLQEVRNARSFATLEPIASRFALALNMAKVTASGRKLRLGTVSLETGKLRFVTEQGNVIEGDQVTTVGTMAGPAPSRAIAIARELQTIASSRAALQIQLIGASPGDKPDLVVQIKALNTAKDALLNELATLLAAVPRVPLVVPLPDGILASSSIAVLFPPVQLGGEHYVDGGHRDQLSAGAAAILGATSIYSVLASPISMDAPTPDNPTPHVESYASKSLIEIGIRAGLAVHLNEMTATDVLAPTGFTGQFTLIFPTVSLHDVLTIDPGMIRQNIAYGFMRAGDVIDQVAPAVAKTADEITLLRAQIWRKECELFGRPIPTDPSADTLTPVPAKLGEVLGAAARLRGLVVSRRHAGGALPDDAVRWGTTWEDHPWYSNCEGPLTSITPFADGLEIFGHARDGRTMTYNWAPSTGWRGPIAMAHGVGPTNGWIEAVVVGSELYAFVIAADGGIQRSIRPINGRSWSMWWPVGVTNQGTARSNPGAPVHAISRVPGEVDLFWANTRGVVLTTHWSETTGWSQPREISGGKTGGGGHVTVVSRNPLQLDVFVVGTDHRVYTAGMTAGSPWTGWVPIGTQVSHAGAHVSAVSRAPNFIDIFMANSQGQTVTAALDPSTPLWKGWWGISGGVTAPNSYVTGLVPSPNSLAAFCVGTDRQVYMAFWPSGAGWSGWQPVPGSFAVSGLPVFGVSRRASQVDLFYTGSDLCVKTAACEAPGMPFGGPWQLDDHWQLDDLS